ncbi:MAG: transglycosylase SLT domain-containing protein [Mycobacterium sp.]
MTADPLTRRALELLARGHNLYLGDRIGPDVVDTPDQLPGHAERLARVAASPGTGAAAAQSRRLGNDLRRTAAADAELIRLLSAAHADREMGRDRTRAVLDDGRADPMPAAATPMGRREAMRRMATRLQTQRRYIYGSQRHSDLLARRMSRLTYLRRRQAARRRCVSTAHAISLNVLRYNRSFAPGRVKQRIAAALDRLGINDPAARRNWTRGYETLIARESGGRPSVVASAPATAPGPTRPDGYGLGYARGLTQTIPTTFAQNHQPGTSTNIYDPVANICASMNYVMHRYGVFADGSNLVALVQQADRHRPPKGY